MSDDRSDDTTEMTRAEVTAFEGPLVLEFGAAWCGYCRTLAPAVAELVRQFPQVTHVKIEDGPGKPLGRSFQVKLWPTLVFLRDGQVQKIAVRPAPASATPRRCPNNVTPSARLTTRDAPLSVPAANG